MVRLLFRTVQHSTCGNLLHEERRMSERRYTVQQCNADGKPVTTVNYREANVALTQFERCLHGAGHPPAKVVYHLNRWTVTLMNGGTEYTVLDPGMQGSVSVSVGTTPAR